MAVNAYLQVEKGNLRTKRRLKEKLRFSKRQATTSVLTSLEGKGGDTDK
jgi:hypothetical protein